MDLIRGGNLARLLDALGTHKELRQVLEACCHEDPKKRPALDELTLSYIMPFCSTKHVTILAWGKVRPRKVSKTVLQVPP